MLGTVDPKGEIFPSRSSPSDTSKNVYKFLFNISLKGEMYNVFWKPDEANSSRKV